MQNNLPLLAQIRKKGNDITLLSAFISKITRDIALEKLGKDVGEIQVRINEKSISLRSSSPLISSELGLFREDIKKASQAKLGRLGYTLPDDIRLIIR